MSGPARLLIKLISFYRALTVNRLSPCRFVPTCSQYGLDAINAYGAARGSWLTAKRIARCRPFAHAGIDPVPEPHKA